jgi:hypothetical protein
VRPAHDSEGILRERTAYCELRERSKQSRAVPLETMEENAGNRVQILVENKWRPDLNYETTWN